MLKEEKTTIKRIHSALFYMDGKYYNLSNRITGIQYVSRFIIGSYLV